MEIVTPFSYKLTPTVPSSPLYIQLGPHSYSNEDYTLHWPDPNTHPHYFHSAAEKAFSQFQNLHHARAKQAISNNPVTFGRTPLLIPIIQAGQFNVREEESTIQLLFRTLIKGSRNGRPLLDLTSGYFSLYTPYQDLVLNTPNVDCRIVAASPKVRALARVPVILLVFIHRSLGEWVLRLQRHFGENSRRVHIVRKTIHEGSRQSRQVVEGSIRNRRTGCVADRVGKARVDLSCEGYVYLAAFDSG